MKPHGLGSLREIIYCPMYVQTKSHPRTGAKLALLLQAGIVSPDSVSIRLIVSLAILRWSLVRFAH